MSLWFFPKDIFVAHVLALKVRHCTWKLFFCSTWKSFVHLTVTSWLTSERVETSFLSRSQKDEKNGNSEVLIFFSENESWTIGDVMSTLYFLLRLKIDLKFWKLFRFSIKLKFFVTTEIRLASFPLFAIITNYAV